MPQTRQLAAIMFTDIVGYTALMGEDEQKAFDLLHKNREIQQPVIKQFNGTWIKEIGDGVLASFHTVTDAVLCAVTIQESCMQTPDLRLRIGIHLGEVILEDDDVFGDGVNIASRLQALAPIGGIWVSESVHNNVSNKKEIESHFVKEATLKNVRKPVRIYQIKLKKLEIPKPEVGQSNLDRLATRPFKKPFTRRMAVIFSLGIIIILSGYFIYYSFQKNVLNNPGIIDKSIAVLPFVNRSNDQQQEYFSDGLSEELLNRLAKIPELKVIARTSSFSFKGKNEDLRSIARKLGVTHILEGSVRKDGNKIRVTAQLIKATDGSNLWNETYDRDLEEVFKLQDEIAGVVVKHLRLKLLAEPSGTDSPINTEAYNLILQGNYFLDKRDKENVAKALEFYRQALALDSLNARAWAAVAKCFNIQASWGWIDRGGFKEARKAATKAIALDEKQAEGHRALGEAKMYDFDWEGAEAEFQKAVNLEPGNPDVLRIMGLLARALGRLDEAMRLDKQSLVLDPIRPITYLHLGLNMYYANRLDEAIVSLKKALELNQQFPRAHTYLGYVYLLQGKPAMALEEMLQETDENWKDYSLILAYQALGRQKEADEGLKNYIARFQESQAFGIAEIYAVRGEEDKAFGWLEKAHKARDVRFAWFKNNPLLKNLESDPRYIALLKKLSLPLD